MIYQNAKIRSDASRIQTVSDPIWSPKQKKRLTCVRCVICAAKAVCRRRGYSSGVSAFTEFYQAGVAIDRCLAFVRLVEGAGFEPILKTDAGVIFLG